jgi:YidC/Oxa1 family membrane protein insertase
VRWAAVALLLLAPTAQIGGTGTARAADGTVRLAGTRQEVLVNLTGGLPARWVTCARDCRADGPRQTMVFLRVTPGGGRLGWSVPGDPAGEVGLNALSYTATVGPGAEPSVLLTSVARWQGVPLVHRFRLRADGAGLDADIQVPPGAVLQLTGGEDLATEELSGLGAWYSRTRSVLLTAEGESEVRDDNGTAASSFPLAAGDWAGVRSRFWALLIRPDEPLRVRQAPAGTGVPGITLGEPAPAWRAWRFTVYAGPVERATLTAVDPALGALLYAAIWDWLRALSFGLAGLLDAWQELVGNWGLAIVLLSLSVKVLMWPLTRLAERWQADVNRIQSRLQPELAAVRAAYRGEAAHERTLAVYRQHGVSPYFTLRSLAGFLIQIPIFIAAFDMLGEHFGLAGAAFLWIHDLALPDRFIRLPLAVPFFGSHLHLLPFLMTACTVLAARLQEEPSLAPELRGTQRLRLYAMAALFFVLLYTFPAGMVLYWTTNNMVHLVRVLATRGRLAPGRG